MHTSEVLGYIAIGIIAFLLGAFVTVFCYRLKKWREQENDRNNHV